MDVNCFHMIVKLKNYKLNHSLLTHFVISFTGIKGSEEVKHIFKSIKDKEKDTT